MKMNKIHNLYHTFNLNPASRTGRINRARLRLKLRVRKIQNILLLIIILSLSNNLSCSVYETFVNISRLKFKLGNVSSFSLNGVDLTSKKKIEDFTTLEVLKISSGFASGKLPVSFILNVEANNPNDGTGGYRRTDASIKNFPWRLFIDDKETVSGNINSPVFIPGTGEIINIPFSIGLDLIPFFKERGYESILNLALNIGGHSGSASKLTLYAQPTVSTSLGDITYPEEIKIVNFQYSN
jgi:hypothetical protein